MTTVVTDELVEECAECLAQRMHKHQIKRHLEELLGFKYSAATHEKLLGRAKKIIIERSARPRSEHLALAIEFWEKLMADPEATKRDKMKCQRELQELLGLGAKWGSIRDMSPDDQAEMLRQAVKAMDEATEAEQTATSDVKPEEL